MLLLFGICSLVFASMLLHRYSLDFRISMIILQYIRWHITSVCTSRRKSSEWNDRYIRWDLSLIFGVVFLRKFMKFIRRINESLSCELIPMKEAWVWCAKESNKRSKLWNEWIQHQFLETTTTKILFRFHEFCSQNSINERNDSRRLIF